MSQLAYLRIFLRVFLLIFPAPLLAAESLPSPVTSLVQMLFGLGLTLAALFGGLVLLKRLQGRRGNPMGALRILGATAVGTREKVVLLAVGKQVLVLGVAPGQITTLYTLSEADMPSEPVVPGAATGAARSAGDFSSRLKQILERRREH